jgi:polyphosphate glucokinase
MTATAERKRKSGSPVSPGSGPHTLAIDIGGTALKASVLDGAGRMIVDRVRVLTPYPCHPEVLLDAIIGLTAPLPAFDRVSIGFPGVIRGGRVLTAPHFGNDEWRDFPLESAASSRFARPTRLLNDAEIQGLGIIGGQGLELVLTLGTGVGSAVFSAGSLAPHLELAQHPLHNGKTYNEYLGNKALHQHGAKRWNQRVHKMIGIVESLLNYDCLYVGGGNARHLSIELPQNVRITSNDAGITGGIYLWDDRIWRGACDRTAAGDPRAASGNRPAQRQADAKRHARSPSAATTAGKPA